MRLMDSCIFNTSASKEAIAYKKKKIKVSVRNVISNNISFSMQILL